MSTAASVAKPAGRRLVLHNVSWRTYESLLHDIAERHLFLTYYRGTLEIMSPSFPHDRYSRLLFMLIHTLARHERLPIVSAGSTTLRRKALKVGIEADEAFYIKNAHAVLDLQEIDLAIHPPPDLAVEIEVSRRLGKRKSAYQKLKVPEVWIFDGHELKVRVLAAGGRYVQADRSPTFANVSREDLARFTREGLREDEVTWINRFEEHLKSATISRSQDH